MLNIETIASRSSLAIALRNAFGRVARSITLGVQDWLIRREDSIFAEMPDHLLKDIGLSRDSHGALRRERL
ncbi:DUF1127 domain-containing protein [Dongia deserti]|uniref:DUF1127 domain-containing protein n=1 Tax=Dongia deserti TaxID=2268030 RepID=UPI000E649134|nr:DUF1127 domain-containing protein [Dongia deserti]